MEHGKSHGWLHPVMAGLLAAVVVHCVALSSFEIVQHLIGNALVVWLAGVLLGAACYWLGKEIRDKLDEMLDSSGAKTGRPLLETVLSRELPGRKYQWTLVGLGVVTVGFLCALQWVAHETWGFFVHYLHLPGLFVIVAGIVVALLLAWYWRRVERPELKFVHGRPGPLDALVLFLSSPGQTPLPHAQGKYVGGVRMSMDDFIRDFREVMEERLGRLPVNELEVEQHFGKNPWAMPVWSIARRWKEGSLKHVVLIGSRAAGAFQSTIGLAQVLQEALEKAIGPGGPAIHIWPNGEQAEGVDFENFDQLHETLRDVRAFLEGQLKGSAHKRICVDVTGGTKLCTIVGLASTLEPGLTAQYVSTSDKHVSAYDICYQARGDDGLPPGG